MSDLLIRVKWIPPVTGDPEVSATAARINICAGDVGLTRHQDAWAQAVRGDVFASAYPFAMWFAHSWWRLNFESLPMQQRNHDWRMAHELGAANHGFVWPRIILGADGQCVCIWAAASSAADQSVRYLQGLDVPRRVLLANFQQSVSGFIQSVIDRLESQNVHGSDLAKLWQLVQQDMSDPEAFRFRKLEAALGFNPQECPCNQALPSKQNWPVIDDRPV